MHPQTTNSLAPTSDVYCFGFESAGALEIPNEYSGLAVIPAHLYYLRRSQACMSLMSNLAVPTINLVRINFLDFSDFGPVALPG